jgi:hypothetical protein
MRSWVPGNLGRRRLPVRPEGEARPRCSCLVGKGRRPAAAVRWDSNPPLHRLALRGRRRDAAATWESCQLVVTAGSSGDQLACLVWLGAALATRKVAGGSNLATRRSYDPAGVTEARERADEGLCKSIAFRQLPSCHDVYIT